MAKLPTYLLAINQASPFGRQQQHGQAEGGGKAGPKAGVKARALSLACHKFNGHQLDKTQLQQAAGNL